MGKIIPVSLLLAAMLLLYGCTQYPPPSQAPNETGIKTLPNGTPGANGTPSPGGFGKNATAASSGSGDVPPAPPSGASGLHTSNGSSSGNSGAGNSDMPPFPFASQADAVAAGATNGEQNTPPPSPAGGMADLKVDSIKVHIADSPDEQGNYLVTIYPQITNAGTETSGLLYKTSFAVSEFIDGKFANQNYFGQLRPGSSANDVFSSYYSPGLHTINVTLNPYSSDANHSNDVLIRQINVPGPDDGPESGNSVRVTILNPPNFAVLNKTAPMLSNGSRKAYCATSGASYNDVPCTQPLGIGYVVSGKPGATYDCLITMANDASTHELIGHTSDGKNIYGTLGWSSSMGNSFSVPDGVSQSFLYSYGAAGSNQAGTTYSYGAGSYSWYIRCKNNDGGSAGDSDIQHLTVANELAGA